MIYSLDIGIAAVVVELLYILFSLCFCALLLYIEYNVSVVRHFPRI